MKKILLLIGLIAFNATAQTYVTNDLQIATTITNSATYTFAGTNYVDLTRYSQVAFELKFQGVGAASGNVTVTFKRGGTTGDYETTPGWTFIVPANGTTAVIALTNYDSGPIAFAKLNTIVSAAGANLTNATLRAFVKGYRRD